MAVTPNYSWPVPDDTDLVKDGAEAIRDLGNAIDTTVDSLPSGGLVHINSTSFSAVASQSINDVFSAAYDNYKIIANLKASTNVAISMRYRVAGSDNSSANYSLMRIGLNSASLGDNFGNSSQSSFTNICNTSTDYFGSLDLTCYFPFLTERTTMSGTGHGLTQSFGAPSVYSMATLAENSISFTGFSLIASTGTITGTVRIYGVKNA